jgi:GR25 family glycosyltransferase involved in LPS biosynthesis
MTNQPPAQAFPFRSFVINLDRQPERMAEFRTWNETCGLPIERFPAIDGNTLDEATRLSVTDIPQLTWGAVASAMSHRDLWRLAADTFQTIVIFEDDAVLRLDIASAIPRMIGSLTGFWDIILLGINTNSVFELRAGEKLGAGPRFTAYPSREELVRFRGLDAPPHLHRLGYAFGLPGYMISPLGARKLLELCFPIRERGIKIPGLEHLRGPGTLDVLLNAFYSTVTAYVAWPPLVLTPNDPVTSGTQNETRRGRSKIGPRVRR